TDAAFPAFAALRPVIGVRLGGVAERRVAEEVVHLERRRRAESLRIVGEEAGALAELCDRAEFRREARVILRRTVGIGIERIVLRIEAVEVEAERGIERERAVEQT